LKLFIIKFNSTSIYIRINQTIQKLLKVLYLI